MKRKDKKKRHKIKHLAEKESVTIEEIEERHKIENEAKRLQDIASKKEDDERQRHLFDTVAAEERRRLERLRQQNVLQGNPEKIVKQKNAAQSKHVKCADEISKSAKPEELRAPEVQTQFTHLKIKKSDMPVAAPVQKVVAAQASQ